MFLFILLLFTIFVLTAAYLKGRYNETYWRKRGVKFDNRNRLMGPFWDFITGDRAFFEILVDMYKKYPDEPAVGFGSLWTPALYVKDVTNVLYVVQGSMFIDRGVDYIEDDYLADNILFMSGARWKLMRQKMTPLFTSAKLKNMYYIMDKSAQDFIEYLHNHPVKQKPKETYETLTTFCCAAVGAAVFGVSSKSTFDSPFLDMAKKAARANLLTNIKFALASLSPKLFKALRLKFFKEFEPFFIGAMKQVFRQREQENVKKHDFADICLSIQKNGVMKNEDENIEMQPTDELLAAQGFFFFIAGVEPAASSVFGAMIEIGRHSEIQKRVQEEVDNVFDKYDGKLSFDAISEMEYLDNVINEALRVYPPIGFSTRRCTEDTVLPVGNIKIEKGTAIFTPIYEYHHDAKYFENPQEFNPDRFADKKNLGVIYQPFGFGNRTCIGMRYAKLQVKCGLAHIIHNFELKTVVGKGGIKFHKEQVQLRIENVDVEYIPRKEKRM
uniref:unspecific monooxygenase n=1 Tax=Chilo suppressalis TaxID=168631 RepID=X5DT24_CHISP|nr:CYP321F3 [Chilo suppressalis]